MVKIVRLFLLICRQIQNTSSEVMRKELFGWILGTLIMSLGLIGCESKEEKTTRLKKEMKEQLWLFGDTYGQTVGRRFFTYEELETIDSIQRVTYSTLESLEEEYEDGELSQEAFAKKYIETLKNGTKEINVMLDVLDKRIEETDEIKLLEETTG